MKKIFIGITSIFLFNSAVAQNNYFNTTGNVSLGQSGGTALLTLNWQYAQIKMQGANHLWLNSDIIVSRLSSGNVLGRSPNIAFADEATNSAAYIQSYQGNLQFFPGGSQAFTLLPGAKVGIANNSPATTLQVETSVNKLSVASASALGGTSYIGFNAYRDPSAGVWRFDGTGAISAGSVIYGDQAGNINFVSVPTQNGGGSFNLTDPQIKCYTYFQVTSGGAARAKQVKIELTGWCDYVFDKGYKLPSLQSVKKYIDENHHLPDVPSTAEMVSNGLDVAEMNKILMKKVEELTLHLIEKEKKDDERDKLLISLQKKINELEKATSKN